MGPASALPIRLRAIGGAGRGPRASGGIRELVAPPS